MPAQAQSEVRILLIGNSLLRGMKRPLLAMLDRVGVEAKVTALLPGTWSLQDHAGSARTESRIVGRAWDIVIMQDKAVGIDEDNYPAIRTLNDKILASATSFGVQTQVVLAMTWRDRGVGPERYDTLHGTSGTSTSGRSRGRNRALVSSSFDGRPGGRFVEFRRVRAAAVELLPQITGRDLAVSAEVTRRQP